MATDERLRSQRGGQWLMRSSQYQCSRRVEKSSFEVLLNPLARNLLKWGILADLGRRRAKNGGGAAQTGHPEPNYQAVVPKVQAYRGFCRRYHRTD
ncbi:hypothetical protein M758_8G104200 [Ceratodon purpureus]|nr:hypothetical protein M758_8G104200 [Ceratodon purpureus]